MGLIDTIALPLFIVLVGVVALTFVGGYVYRMVSEARTASLAQKRNVRLEQQAYRFVENVFIEASSSTSGVSEALSPELSEELWKLHNQIDLHQELTP